MLPFDDVIMFMQDGTIPHKARINKEFLTSATINVLLSSAKSPDINTIKNVSSVILSRIYY